MISEEKHIQLSKLWATILEIENLDPDSISMVTEDIKTFLKDAKKKLNKLSELYLKTLHAQSQDKFLSLAFLESGFLFNGPNVTVPTGVPSLGDPKLPDQQSNRHLLMNYISSAHKKFSMEGLSTELSANEAKQNKEVEQKETEIYDWLCTALHKDFPQLRVTGAGSCDNQTASTVLASLFKRIRNHIAILYLKHLKGIKWEPPKEAHGKICKPRKNLDTIHAALVTLLDQNVAFFTYPGLKEAANTVSLVNRHKKLSNANGLGPVQRTALSSIQANAFTKFVSNKVTKCMDNVINLETKLKSDSSCSDEIHRNKNKTQDLKNRLSQAQNKAICTSSRLLLWMLGCKSGARFNQAEKAKFEANADESGKPTATISNDANDFKVKGNLDLRQTVCCKKDCKSQENGKTDLSCLCCAIRNHIELRDKINTERNESGRPLVGNHPGFASRSKTALGRLKECVSNTGVVQITQSDRRLKELQNCGEERIPVSSKNLCFDCNAVIETKLVRNINGFAVVHQVPLVGPLAKLKHGDIIAAIKYGSSEQLTKEGEMQLIEKPGTVAKYEQIIELFSTQRSDQQTVRIYYLRSKSMHSDIDGATYLKWLKKMIQAWQDSLGTIGPANDLYLSKEKISNIGTHSARISFAANAHDLGCDIDGIMKALDHTSYHMTFRYIKQSIRSHNAKSRTVEAMATGQLTQTNAAPSQIDRKVDIHSKDPPSDISPEIWRKYRSDVKSYKKAGCLKFQCPNCVAPYDERRFIGFSSKQMLKKHLETCACISSAKSTLKASAECARQNLEKAGVGPDKFLGTVEVAQQNLEHQHKELGIFQRRKKRKRK